MIETREVLAAAYLGPNKGRTMLSHAVQLDNIDRPLRVLCGRVSLSSLADHCAQDTTQPPTCRRCLSKLKSQKVRQ